MSQGRIAHANRRTPAARRRMARYGRTVGTRRGYALPPHLLPGITRTKKRKSHARNGVLFSIVLVCLGFIVLFTAGMVVSTAAAVAGTVHAYREVNKDLPDAAIVASDSFENSIVYDRNGGVLQEIPNPNSGWRTFVPLEKISPELINATIAAEDSTFWSHYGVEPGAIVRGAIINYGGEGSSGGSTITQQLARGLYPNQIGFDISYTRKIKEAMAAVYLDNKFSKEDILTMYLNQIFYGQNSYGIEAASETYFQKHANELTLGEASLLAGLPQAPSNYDPTAFPDKAKARQKYVLKQMVRYHYITQDQADAAYSETPVAHKRNAEIKDSPHFTNYAKDWVVQHYGENALYEGGLKIYTTLDPTLQHKAEEIVRNQMPQLAQYDRNNAAMVAMVPWSGEILVMVGSADFNDPNIGGQVNYAVAPLQPGSSIKPVVYAAAFEDGWNPGTVVIDSTFKEPTPDAPEPYYEPQNYTGNHYGAVSVRTALSNSLNIPAVRAIKYTGVQHVMDLARAMGYKQSLTKSAADYGLSFALGSAEVQLVEHTNLFASFSNEGKYVAANPILKITDSQGKVLYERHPEQEWQSAPQVLKAEYAYQVTSILTDNKARSMIFGESNLFGRTQDELGRPTAAKSGTTDYWKNIWTMGYTTDLAIGVWVGHTTGDGSTVGDLPELDGIAGAGPIWEKMMLEMHQNPQWSQYLNGPNGQPMAKDFPRPAGLYQGSVCVATGGKPANGFESHTELLVRDEGPSLDCDQISAYQAQVLADGLADLRVNGDKYVRGAADSIRRYADAVGYSPSGFGSSQFRGNSPQIQPHSGP
ncbi:MAG: transglycosylase domain-containing protein [Thermomicrobiales bacterium]